MRVRNREAMNDSNSYVKPVITRLLSPLVGLSFSAHGCKIVPIVIPSERRSEISASFRQWAIKSTQNGSPYANAIECDSNQIISLQDATFFSLCSLVKEKSDRGGALL